MNRFDSELAYEEFTLRAALSFAYVETEVKEGYEGDGRGTESIRAHTRLLWAGRWW
jgi:hypothetical protein